jgi:hypothetical protein
MDYKGNKAARRELRYGGGPKRTAMKKGRIVYKKGGGVKMDGCQPVYDGTPQAKAN